jgi:hypothetical protein
MPANRLMPDRLGCIIEVFKAALGTSRYWYQSFKLDSFGPFAVGKPLSFNPSAYSGTAALRATLLLRNSFFRSIR